MQYETVPDESVLDPVYRTEGEANWKSWHQTAMLVRHLTWRSLASRYRGSALGFLWTLVNPICLMFVYTFVFGYIFGVKTPSGIPFQVFLITGLLAWNFFSTASLHAAVSLVMGSGLVNKSAFPRIALPVSAVLANLVNYVVALPLLVIFVIISGVNPTSAIVLLPVGLILLTLISTGLGALLSSLMPFFMDLQHLIEVFLTMWFFLTPIVYDISQVKSRLSPGWQFVYQLNPMVGIVRFMQSVFLGQPIEITSLLIAAVESLVIFVIGLAVFNRLSVHCTEV
jgi:lipopolysaccharide transport system permease protein